MSDEDVIRGAIDAWNEGGVDAFMEHVTADVEWHAPQGFPEGEVWAGRDAVAGALKEQFGAVFSSGRVEVRSVTRGPGGWLLAAHHRWRVRRAAWTSPGRCIWCWKWRVA